jgi:hypothetical protein
MDEAGNSRNATAAEMVEDFGPLVRIEVPKTVARHTWAEHGKLGRIDPRMADALAASARADGADPQEWRLSYRDVSLEAVLGAETSEDGLEWVPVTTPGPEGVGVAAVDGAFVEKVHAAFKKFNGGGS